MILEAITETAHLLRIVLPRMFAGMLIAAIIYSLPAFRRVISRMDSIARFANLKTGVPIAAFFADRYSALSILSEVRKREIIGENEVIITSIIGMFPMSIRSTLLVMGPLALSALGMKYGLVYLSLDLGSKLAISLLGVMMGRTWLDGGSVAVSFRTDLRESVTQSLRQFARVVLILAPSIFIVTLIANAGMKGIPLGTAQLSIVSAGAISTVAGIGVAGTLISNGKMRGGEAVFYLIIAQMLHRVVESIRHSMPVNLSLFGTSLGIRLTIALFIAGELSCVLSLAGLYVLSWLSIV